MIITANNEQETKQIAHDFAVKLTGGEVICLFGELGAGKTVFVKGLARALGVHDNITSPTFTLMNLYSTNTTNALTQTNIKFLIHIDTYRLKNEQELLDIGIDDYLGKPDKICIIEWPEKMKNILDNKKVINIYIDHLTKNSRKITIAD